MIMIKKSSRFLLLRTRLYLPLYEDDDDFKFKNCISSPVPCIFTFSLWFRPFILFLFPHLFSFLLLLADFIVALKDVSVTIPQAVKRGSNAMLTCNYDMENDTLYSVKWYKGRREFYRYTPKENPAMKVFLTQSGLNVEVSFCWQFFFLFFCRLQENWNVVCICYFCMSLCCVGVVWGQRTTFSLCIFPEKNDRMLPKPLQNTWPTTNHSATKTIIH